MTASLAARIHDGNYAEQDLENQLEEAGARFERLGFDDYDNSVELYEVPPDYRLSPEAQKIIHEAGFSKAFVNHTDKWETHYGFKAGDFVEARGWRVSYPHKRDNGEPGIWVEEVCPTWPKGWFATGYAIVKERLANLTDPSHVK